MNGAESLVHTLIKSGLTTCFANPGTSEMHFVSALDRIAGVRCVLGLSESVVTGAADGFFRMTQMPAVTLLHCAPGLSNGLSNLHNARRAKSGIVNIVGDQATGHRPLDPPLTGDTEGLARSVSAWTRTSRTAADVARDLSLAIQMAKGPPGSISTLIAPADTCWDEGGCPADPLPTADREVAAPHKIDNAIRLLRSGPEVCIIVGDAFLDEDSLADVGRIVAASGSKAMLQQFNARVERGRGRYPIRRLPYAIDKSLGALAGIRHLLLVGATAPVAPFAYPQKPQHLEPEGAGIHVLARPHEDVKGTLAMLADALSASLPSIGLDPAPTELGRGTITPERLLCSLATLLPEEAIVVDESVSTGRDFFDGMSAAVPHDWLQLTGGAIGSGLPMAIGASVARPGRPVVSLQADGSAAFTAQALWTQARENLRVITVLLSNRKYAILLGELRNVGANPGPTALSMLDLGNPEINWTMLARALGVEAARAETMESFNQLFSAATQANGPFLIEVMI